MVEVFKTNIREAKEANNLLGILKMDYPFCKINIDMEDCDRVLRIEGILVSCEEIMARVQSLNFECQPLE